MGTLGFWLASRQHRHPGFLWILARVAFNYVLFCIIIRLGNFFNSEILGEPTDLPWAVTFALVDCRDALAATGTGFDTIFALGGGSRSDYWVKAIATALGQPVDLPAAGDFGAAFGAARLGMMAATGDTAIATPPPVARTVDPNPALAPAFAEAHARYRTASHFLKDFA